MQAPENPPTRRPPKWFVLKLIPCLGFYVFAAAFFNFFSVLLVPDLTKEATIDIQGLSGSDWNQVAVTLVGLTQDPYILDASALRTDKSFHWTSYRRWFKQIRLHASAEALNHIQSIEVKVGDTVKTFNQEEIKHWTKLEPETWMIPNATPPVASLAIPRWEDEPAINSPQPDLFAVHVTMPGFQIALFITALVCSVWWFGERPNFQSFLKTILSDVPRAPARESLLTFFLGLAFVIVALASYYPGQRYPFTQDDNFVQFLPVIIRSCETLAHGKMPVWNPNQLLGAPTTSVGTYALTYPPTFFSYQIAHTLLHDDCATIEVFNLCHLILGYIACFWALRCFGISSPLAVAGSMSWVLCGWFLLGGRAQFNYTPLALYFPLLISAVNRLHKKAVGWRWCLGTGLVIGLYFHAGHAEFWVYTLLFSGLAALLIFLCGEIPWRRALWGVSALLLGLSIAAPLLVLQKLETDGINRMGGYGYSINTLALFLPQSLPKLIGLPTGKFDYDYDPQIYYAGTLFTIGAFATLALWLSNALVRPSRLRRDLISSNSWLLCGGLAFVLALAAQGVLWSILCWFPLFDKFRWPVKYTPIIHMLFIFGGAAVLERIFNKSHRAKFFILASVAILLCLHVFLCKSSFFDTSGFCDFRDRPYPSLEEATQTRLDKPASGRVLPVAPWQSQTEGFAQSLQSNLPSQYKLLSYDGYDTFISTKPLYIQQFHRMFNDPANTARALGIGWVAWSTLTDCPQFRGNPSLITFPLELPQASSCKIGWSLFKQDNPISVTQNLKLFKIATPDPIAFCSDHPDKPLSYEADQAGVTVRTTGIEANTPITVNFLCWPWMTAWSNGKQLSVKSDKWDRIQLVLPSPTDEIVIAYSPPWMKSFFVAFILFALALVSGLVAHHLERKSKTEGG